MNETTDKPLTSIYLTGKTWISLDDYLAMNASRDSERTQRAILESKIADLTRDNRRLNEIVNSPRGEKQGKSEAMKMPIVGRDTVIRSERGEQIPKCEWPGCCNNAMVTVQKHHQSIEVCSDHTLPPMGISRDEDRAIWEWMLAKKQKATQPKWEVRQVTEYPPHRYQAIWSNDHTVSLGATAFRDEAEERCAILNGEATP